MKHATRTQYGLGLAGLLIGGVAGLGAQVVQNGAVKPSPAVSTLPAAQTTDVAGGRDTPTTPTVAPHHIEVEFAGGKLAVQATNASLNEILHEVGKKTNMKITGSVADDKVFGDYGPSSPSVVLEALLEGTGTNILMVDDAKGGSELILTPRHGAATPPNPNAAQTRESEENNGDGAYVAPVRAYQPPGTGRGPAGGAPNLQVGPPGGDSPDAAKTPQQIYDTLQEQQRRQAATQQTNPQ